MTYNIEGNKTIEREPNGVKRLMNQYRRGLAPLPQAYVTHHSVAAEEVLMQAVLDHGLVVHRKWLDDDGWCDGMRVLLAVVETRSGKLFKIKWHDGNRGFMFHCERGGWAIMREGMLK